jgi:hypothetical protein
VHGSQPSPPRRPYQALSDDELRAELVKLNMRVTVLFVVTLGNMAGHAAAWLT